MQYDFETLLKSIINEVSDIISMFQITIHMKLIMLGNNFIFVIHHIYAIFYYTILVNAKIM
jgi:hypothetical protein